MAEQKAILQAVLEGCSALDWSGAFAPTSVNLLYYDISEGKVVATTDVNVLPTRFLTAIPDMSGAFVISRDGPVQLVEGEVIGLESALSLCLHPIVEEAMKCVDNDDVGTWEVTPTAIDDNCVVLTFNQVYTEPGESSCEESFCQGECVRDALTAAMPLRRAHWCIRAFPPRA